MWARVKIQTFRLADVLVIAVSTPSFGYCTHFSHGPKFQSDPVLVLGELQVFSVGPAPRSETAGIRDGPND